MKWMLRYSWMLLLALAVFLPQVAGAEPLGIVTGPKTGTYIAIGRDIAELAKKKGIKAEVKVTDGSIENIRRMNSNENAALGIVQSDVLGFMARSQNADTLAMADHLRMIFPLYREEVHVLAHRDIKSFGDLNGKRVVIGENGSGHMVTAINLFAMMDVTPGEIIKQPLPEGLLALLDGKVDAVFFVGGKPIKLFKNLEQLAGADGAKYESLLQDVHFLPLNTPRMLEEYPTTEITANDYSFVRESVPTIAVTAILVTYDFTGKSKAHRARCKQLRTLSSAIKKSLPSLQKNGHPKWHEVNLTEVPPLWRKDVCSWPNEKLAHNTKKKPKKSGQKRLDKDLIDVIERR